MPLHRAPTLITIARPPDRRDEGGKPLPNVDLARWARRQSSLDRARTKAYGADVGTYKQAIADLHNLTSQPGPLPDAKEVARLARRVAREADKITAEHRLREYEHSLVDAGLASWGTA